MAERRGPKDKAINWDLFELYAKSRKKTTTLEIADALGVHRNTLYRQTEKRYGMKYEAVCAKFLIEGELLLEAAMFQKAMKSSSPGNITMLMFLAKTKLGYREPDNVQTIPPNQDNINKDHKIMLLENELQQLRFKLANLPETE